MVLSCIDSNEVCFFLEAIVAERDDGQATPSDSEHEEKNFYVNVCNPSKRTEKKKLAKKNLKMFFLFIYFFFIEPAA